MNIRDIMHIAPVIPVLVIDDIDTSINLAQALVDGGLRTLEITLRTPAAFDAIDAIRSSVNDAVVGAGTVNTIEQLTQCEQHQVDFIVSPGLYLPLVIEAQARKIPYLPGISNATDALTAVNAGLDSLKFFPALASGGIAMLKALKGPYGDLRFCPTGGINAGNAGDFLMLDNVSCVGGSWVAPKKLITEGNWKEITRLATDAANMSN